MVYLVHELDISHISRHVCPFHLQYYNNSFTT